MSARHPIISVTGSSGAGTTTVKHTFDQIFRREGIKAAYIEGDAFHRYDRAGMKAAEAAANGNNHFSHFGPEANLLEDLASVFEEYGRSGTGRTRHYVHDDREAQCYGSAPGTFTPWEDFPASTDLLFYEGLHGAVVRDGERGAARRPQDRGRAGHQPRMDPEDPPRQGGPRLLDRGRDGHDPAADARLHPLHLPAVLRDRHQLPAGA